MFLARVPQARAVRVVGATLPVDRALLELYLESERRSGGGALEGLCSLPGRGGIVATFQQWQGEWQCQPGLLTHAHTFTQPGHTRDMCMHT